MPRADGFRPRRILVHIDTASGRRPALTRALQLAGTTGGSLRLVDVLASVPWYTPHHARLDRLLRATMKERLADAVSEARESGVRTTMAVLEGDVADALVSASLTWRADVVLRSHSVTRAAPRPIGPTDAQLLRRCPCPVWFVTPRQAHGEKVVVAAVAPDPADASRQDLAVRVARTAAAVAAGSGAALHVVHAWTAYGHSVLAAHSSRTDVQGYVHACRIAARDRLDGLMADAGLPATTATHLIRGPGDAVLSRILRREHASLIVLGTVGRTGLAGLVVGNTAERVLRSARCSVLALKPAGFAHAMVEGR